MPPKRRLKDAAGRSLANRVGGIKALVAMASVLAAERASSDSPMVRGLGVGADYSAGEGRSSMG